MVAAAGVLANIATIMSLGYELYKIIKKYGLTKDFVDNMIKVIEENAKAKRSGNTQEIDDAAKKLSDLINHKL